MSRLQRGLNNLSQNSAHSITGGTISRMGSVGNDRSSGKGFEDRLYDETGFDTTPISRHEWDEARQNIFDRLRRLREQMEDEERETGRCRSCGQALPNLTFGQDSA